MPKKNNQWEKIIFFMQKHPEKLFKVSDFSGAPTEFNHHVGYKAGTRISELVKKGYVETAGKYKEKMLFYRITPEGMKVQTLYKIMNESRKEKKDLLRIFSDWWKF